MSISYFNSFFKLHFLRLIRSPISICFQIFYIPLFIIIMYGNNLIDNNDATNIVSRVIFLSCFMSFISNMATEMWEFRNTDFHLICKMTNRNFFSYYLISTIIFKIITVLFTVSLGFLIISLVDINFFHHIQISFINLLALFCGALLMMIFFSLFSCFLGITIKNLQSLQATSFVIMMLVFFLSGIYVPIESNSVLGSILNWIWPPLWFVSFFHNCFNNDFAFNITWFVKIFLTLLSSFLFSFLIWKRLKL